MEIFNILISFFLIVIVVFLLSINELYLLLYSEDWNNLSPLLLCTSKCLNQWSASFLSSCCCLKTKSCLTLCGPMDCSPPGSSVHGILQARILEWVAISFSTGSSRPRDQIEVFRMRQTLPTAPPGKSVFWPLQYFGLENSIDCYVTGSQRVGHKWATFTFTYI